MRSRRRSKPIPQVRCLFLAYLGSAILVFSMGVDTLRGQVTPSVPRLTFTKTLKGSTPEYMALKIGADGKGTYESRLLTDTAVPRPLQVSPATTEQIFSLAKSLNYFQSITLNSRRKVANLGLKTLQYDAGTESHRVEYNYTENRTAQQLTDILEKIGSVEEHIGQLEYDMRYDHLGLPQTLAEIQDEMADHDLVEAELLTPTLEKISADSRFLHLAQVRAQEIMHNIQEHK